MQCSTISYNHITQPVLSHHTDSTLSLHFNGHFLGEPRLAGVYRSKGWWKWWWQLDYRSYVVQSSSQIITTNKPTSNFFTGQMPFLSPNQQCQSTEGKISHSMDLLTPSSPGSLPTLSLTTITQTALLATMTSHSWCYHITQTVLSIQHLPSVLTRCATGAS